MKIAMKKTIIAIGAALAATCTTGAQPKADKGEILVAYFSATGTTAYAARTIAEVTGGTLHEIVPAVSYSGADLNWNDRNSRSSVEMKDPDSRPEIKDTGLDISRFNVIFIGYPIWWNEAPRIINTFIEAMIRNDEGLKDKTIIPFATSGGSSIANSTRVLKQTYPDLEWLPGRLLNRTGRSAVAEWIGSLSF